MYPTNTKPKAALGMNLRNASASNVPFQASTAKVTTFRAPMHNAATMEDLQDCNSRLRPLRKLAVATLAVSKQADVSGQR
jgi:hypothetical protein